MTDITPPAAEPDFDDLMTLREYRSDSSAALLTSEAQLQVALRQLGEAHEEIGRLVRLANGAVPSNAANSSMSGTKVLDNAVRRKEYESAYIWAKALWPRHKENQGFLRSLRTLQVKRGEMSSVLELTYRLALKDKKIEPASIRQMEGRLREISGWVPVIPGPFAPIEGPVENRVLHLVKESRPYLSNGFTSRSHKNFIAEKSSGLDPIVVTEPGYPRGVSDVFKLEEMLDGILHIRLDAGAINYGAIPVDRFLQMYAMMAYGVAKRFKPAAIHASSGRRGYETALVGLALKNKTGLPFVYEVRSFFEANWTGDINHESEGEIFRRRMQIEEMCMHAADRVLTIGEAMKAEIVSRGVPADKIDIIPNAVDLAAFSPRDRSEKLDAKYGTSGQPTFGYVSNMDHYRESQETLIHAAKVLKDRGSPFRCVLVGGGPRVAELQALALELGVGDRVTFTGGVDHNDIPDYYSLIDFFVVPRIAERAATFVTPLKPFEAMALRRPVIVSDLPALVEITDPPNRGVTFPPGDVTALADLLQELLASPERVEAMVTKAFEWVSTDRTWQGNGERYAAVFSKLRTNASSS